MIGYRDLGVKGFRVMMYQKQAAKVRLEFIDNTMIYKIKKNLFNKLPLKLMQYASFVPSIGTPSFKQFVDTATTFRKKADNAVESMIKFIKGDWHFENKRIYNALNMMTSEEIEEFQVETRKINWESYIMNYIKGIGIWNLHENHVSPEHGLHQILIKNPQNFDYFKHGLNPRVNFKEKNTKQYEKAILDENRFQ